MKKSELSNSTPYEQSRKIKKTILHIFVGMVAFVILFFLMSSLVDFDLLAEKIGNKTYNPTNQTIIFVTPDYDENIYEDSYYMGLDRNIYIYDIDTGMTESLEQEDYSGYGAGVKFMADFVNIIISGDAEAYNECFDVKCFDTGDVEEKEAFTMQKLYNIKITRLSEEDVSENGNNYTKYEFALEYMIRHNNSTFRRDIGSDASKIQYITLTDRTGELLIEEVRNHIYQ